MIATRGRDFKEKGEDPDGIGATINAANPLLMSSRRRIYQAVSSPETKLTGKFVSGDEVNRQFCLPSVGSHYFFSSHARHAAARVLAVTAGSFGRPVIALPASRTVGATFGFSSTSAASEGRMRRP